jgi:DNA-binding Lrp family transcriptional regulator
MITGKRNTTMKNDRRLIVGWAGIAQFVGVSIRTMLRRRSELKRKGVIFYHLVGSPPRREVGAYESTLIDWVENKAKRGGYV